MSTPDPRDRDALVAAILRATADLAAARVAYAQGVAERHGLAATDVEVLRLLASEGAMPVGRVGELTALTTGRHDPADRPPRAGGLRPPPPRPRRPAAGDRRGRRGPRDGRAAGVRPRRCGGDARPRLARRRGARGRPRVPDRLRRRAPSDALSRTRPPTGPRAAAASAGAPIASATAGRLVFVTGAPNVTIAGSRGPRRGALPRPVQGCRPVRPRPRRDDHDPLPALRVVRLAGTRRGRVGQRVGPLEAGPDRAAPQRAAAVGDRAARRRHAAAGRPAGAHRLVVRDRGRGRARCRCGSACRRAACRSSSAAGPARSPWCARRASRSGCGSRAATATPRSTGSRSGARARSRRPAPTTAPDRFDIEIAGGVNTVTVRVDDR